MKEKDKKCKYCWGFGLWAIGEHIPMGPIDASEGFPTLPCPECGANKNGRKNKNERKK